MGGITGFLEIIICLLDDLKKRNLSYDEAINEIKKTIEIIKESEEKWKTYINYDKNLEFPKGKTKQIVVEDRKGDIQNQ